MMRMQQHSLSYELLAQRQMHGMHAMTESWHDYHATYMAMLAESQRRRD